MRGSMCCCLHGADPASSAGWRAAEAGSWARAPPLGIRWDHLVPSVRGIRRGSSSRATEALPRAAEGPWWPLHHASAPSGRAAPFDPGASAQSQAAAIASMAANLFFVASTSNVVYMSAIEFRLRTDAGCCGYRYAPYRVVPYDNHSMAAVCLCGLIAEDV